MAQLPSVRDNLVLTEAPRSSVSAADVANPYFQIADALGDAADVFRRQKVEDAGVSGDNAVYRDANNDLQVNLRPNTSAANIAYNRAATVAYNARLAGDVRKAGFDLADKAQGDPAKFSASWQGFSKQILSKVAPELRGAATTMLETTGSQYGVGVSETKRKRDLNIFEGNIKAEIGALDDEMATLARQGGTGTKEYKSRQAQVHSLYDELVHNPDFSVGDKEAGIALKSMESRHMAMALVGHVEQALTTQGIPAARKLADTVLTDTSLQLSPSERQQYAGLMHERINNFGAQRTAELKPIQQKADVIIKRLGQSVGIDGEDVDQTAKALAAGGDMAGAMELFNARAKARYMTTFNALPSDQQAAELERYQAGVPAGMRNNNPANIKFVGQGGERGVIGPSANLDQGDPQAVFATPEAGMAEAYRLARSKYDGGKTTANQLIAGDGGWTPGNYQAAANVARSMGIGPDDDLKLSDPDNARKFMRGLVTQEQGPASQAYSDQMIADAVGGWSPGPRGLIVGMLEKGNIDLANRPVVKNADGSISTVRSMSFEEDGKEVLIPTVSPDGKILSDKDAIALYHKSGQHLGKFDSAESAGRYAQNLHESQAGYYKNAAQSFPIVTQHQAGRVSAPDLKGVQPVVINRFRMLQSAFGASVPIVSGFRDPERNARAGGAKFSQHMHGNALDLDVTGMAQADRVRLIRAAHQAGFTGIGVYDNSIHVDVGPRRAWGPDHHSGSVPDWAKQAVAEAPSAAATSTDYSGVDPTVVEDMRAEVTRDAKASFDDMKQGFLTTPPDSDRINLLSRQLSLINDEDFRSEVRTFFNSSAAAAQLETLPADTRDAFLSSLKGDAQAGASVAQQSMIGSMESARAAQVEALKKDPIGYAVERGIAKPVPAINPTGQPAEVAANLASRQQAVDVLQARGLAGNISAFRPSDTETIANLFRTGTAQQLNDFTNTMASSLSPATFSATLTSPEMKDVLTGAAMSNDPVKHNASMQQLDILASRDGMFEVERVYGADIADRLQDWEGRVRYFSAEETAQWLKERNDPAWQDRIKPLLEKGRSEARKVSVDEIVKGLNPPSSLPTVLDPLNVVGRIGGIIISAAPMDGGSKRSMLNDFERLYADRYAVVQDSGKAQSQTFERMRKVWGNSLANGGRLMPYPPESFYPALGGSTDWVAKEMQAVATEHKLDAGNLALVADLKTEAAVKRGEQPGYLIAVIDPTTGLEDLMRDPQGRPLRHFFDPAAALTESNKAYQEDREYFRPRSREQSLDDYLYGNPLTGRQ